jgi:hypothetical protein
LKKEHETKVTKKRCSRKRLSNLTDQSFSSISDTYDFAPEDIEMKLTPPIKKESKEVVMTTT